MHLYDLRNPFYELKQAGRLWSELLDAKLVDAGFRRYVSDAGLYFRRHEFELTVVSVYVNDLLVTFEAITAWDHSSTMKVLPL